MAIPQLRATWGTRASRWPLGGVERPRRKVRFARLIHRRVRAFWPAFGRRRLQRQSQPELLATRGDPVESRLDRACFWSRGGSGCSSSVAAPSLGGTGQGSLADAKIARLPALLMTLPRSRRTGVSKGRRLVRCLLPPGQGGLTVDAQSIIDSGVAVGPGLRTYGSTRS
jgi:hypothetical protein